MPTRTRIADEAIVGIERYIAEHRCKPGDRLPSQTRLAEILGIGTRSLREAIRTLESRGMLETRHGTGVFVRRPDVDHFLGVLKDTLAGAYADDRRLFLDLSRLRRMLETEVVRALANHTPGGFVRDFATLLERLKTAAESDAISEYHHLDAELHRLIIESSGNRVLVLFYRHLADLFDRCFERTGAIAGDLQTSMTDHEALLASILSGDSDGAARVIAGHIDTTIENLEREHDQEHA